MSLNKEEAPDGEDDDSFKEFIKTEIDHQEEEEDLDDEPC